MSLRPNPPQGDPQQAAANPAISAAVSANAGSGKTKTLVDRVARLLLQGTRPETILCVTFTKAAASEMQRRLFQTLGTFAIARDEVLVEALSQLEGRPADTYDEGQLSAARRLFALALETPGGLKIQTLHGFCEKLLRQFPLEAGVTPGFTVLDDAAEAEVIRRARDQLAEAAADPATALGEAYARLSVKLDYAAFEALFTQLAHHREAIGSYFDAAEGDLPGRIATSLGLTGWTTPDLVLEDSLTEPALDVAAYGRAAAALAQGSEKTDRPNGLKLQASLEAARAGRADADGVFSLFFTKEGEPRRANFPTKSVATWVREWIEQEQARLTEVREQARAARMAAETLDVLLVGGFYAVAYGAAKASAGSLDFADLIVRTRALLSDRPSAAWVLFKLDGGVEHILIDEAQDTSPDQWSIMTALVAEFFAGEDGRERRLQRTVFIVGDEKQSIFSFQGAAPHLLLAQSQRVQDLAHGAGQSFESIQLNMSWRSTPEVLAFVDTVFRGSDRASQLAPQLGAAADGEAVRHVAQRANDPGCVDLWPPVIETTAEPQDAWDPVDAAHTTGAWRTLAERIAVECQAMVRRGDRVKDRTGERPVDYGDILVLVRRRGPLFEETLRELKRRGVPVAGADRLKLSEHLVFQDLTSLARYALYPWDDLTVAEVLRSPLCDLTETDLFDLAAGRRESLSAALMARSAERPAWARAAQMLALARELGQSVPPFEFFARLLCLADNRGRSLRQRFVTRLGAEAGEALDAFLGQALAAEQRNIFDLERFCAGLDALDVTLKREMDEPKGEVRVMTAHGAKGLEAPVVFMADTVFHDQPRPSLATLDDGVSLIWLPAGGTEDSRVARSVRDAVKLRERDELARLLYVGLTRARDRLILCGRLKARGTVDGAKGWLPWLAEAFDVRLAESAREVTDDQGFAFRRFGADPVRGAAAPTATPAVAPSPGWIQHPAPAEPTAQAWASPTALAERNRGATPSPLAATGGLGRFRRGDLIHRLFQLLPDLPAPDRAGAAARILAKERDLTPEQRLEMAAAALNVLEDPRFAEVFGPGSRPEAAIAGTAPELPAGLAISGRVDRMTVTPDRVLVVDFKTNRPAPDRVDNADPAYLTQMAVYVAVLRAIFPGRRVDAALVWTDGPKLMPVPENLIVERLNALRRAS